jgi:methylated-DNA-protein-cysteine methyltransferase-like protein
MESSGKTDAMKVAIIRCVAAIPHGQVMSYGDVARQAGYRGRARQVGRILREAGDENLPWHRVLRADGQLGFPKGSQQWWEQRTRLNEEGVRFRDDRVQSGCFCKGLSESTGGTGKDMDAILWGDLSGEDAL